MPIPILYRLKANSDPDLIVLLIILSLFSKIGKSFSRIYLPLVAY